MQTQEHVPQTLSVDDHDEIMVILVASMWPELQVLYFEGTISFQRDHGVCHSIHCMGLDLVCIVLNEIE